MKRHLIIAVSSFVVILLTSALAQEPINIGVVMNLTGHWASIDTPCANGVELAASQINGAGDILGREICLEIVDTMADEEETRRAVVRGS